MRRYLGLLAAVLLAGCAVAPTERPADDREAAWQQHRAAVAALERWHLNGRLAVQTDEQGWHATLDWRQAADHYRIRIVGPLGQGGVYLDGTPDQVLLKTGNNESTAADPEELLRQETGWQVPVAFLRYWVLGLPAPDAPARHELDPQGRLAKLSQSGWEIEFLDYRATGGPELPGRVVATHYDAKVKLVVGNWNLQADG